MGQTAELNLAVFQAEKDKVIPGKEIKSNWHQRVWCTWGKHNSVWLEHQEHVGETQGMKLQSGLPNLQRMINVIQKFRFYPFAMGPQRRVFKQCPDIIRFVFHKWNSGDQNKEELAGEEVRVRETS